ncbi:SURF1 family protein [Micromonospora sonneratiae]|uniref:SURF1-like protein n=1 Tax=Micromonospora sonneratiae TaxID=1184706 RepID=A0ABW3YCI2_9ACTN
MYRFLLTPRWLGIFALTLVAAMVMVLLGNWQLDRYRERDAINKRIDAATEIAPVPLTEALPGPGDAAGTAGQAPPEETAWTRVTATGRYDSNNIILVRGRTVNNQVGFEVLTPLILADGSAVLVDRGWIPPAPEGANARPAIPAVPTGEVTVVGRVRMSESRPDTPQRRDGQIETRRISVSRLAAELPYPSYGAFLLLDEQTPAADPAFSAIPVRHENNWQNGGYVVQWWLFALMTLIGFGWLARREAHGEPSDAAKHEDRVGDDPVPVGPAGHSPTSAQNG